MHARGTVCSPRTAPTLVSRPTLSCGLEGARNLQGTSGRPISLQAVRCRATGGDGQPTTRPVPGAGGGAGTAAASESGTASSGPGSTSGNGAASSTPRPIGGPFRGSFIRKQATTQTEPVVAPLTALHQCDPPSWPKSAAREGLYSDVPVDRVDSLHTQVVGKLPPWLKGSFYRNGPGKFEGAHAVFDGCAMLVRFRMDGASNEVVLSHRFLESVYYKAVKDHGRVAWKMAHSPEAGKTTLQGLAYAGGMALAALKYGRHMGDNALISIFPQGNELIAHTETVSGTYRVHPETLETLGRVQYTDSIHGLIKTAHPHTMPNGDIIGMVADFSPFVDNASSQLRLPEITLYRQSPWQTDRRHKLAAVPYMRPTAPTWIHQVPVSEHYAVVVQNPVFYNVKALVMGQATDYMVFDWRPECGSLLHVVPLLGGPVKTYRGPAFLASHWVNAFESEDGRLLHLDAAVTDNPALMSHWELETVRAGPVGGKQIGCSFFRRLTIDLTKPDGSFLDQQPLLQRLVPDEAHGYAFEMPAINPNNISKPYRYVYGTCCVRPANCWNAICKLDTHTGEVRVWHEPGGAAWEPVFTPRPGGKAEDDGCVLSTVMQPDGRSALLVLDAKSWKEVARAVLPYALPNGFHGCFVPS